MAETMCVQVRKCSLRKKPSFLGAPLRDLDYGDQVTIDETRNSWVRVTPVDGKGSGWLHLSALTEKKIILGHDSPEVKTGASSDEIALAGKGFNRQVEERFKQNNRNVDFAPIDAMEKIVISQAEMHAFLVDGGLDSLGEGQT